MTPIVGLDLFREAIMLIILMVTVMVIPALVVGLIISMFQAATQINEQTLSFLPRLITTLAMLMFAGPFLLSQILDFMRRLAESVPLLLG
jgi:flagellar biosynthetic protein FliQ